MAYENHSKALFEPGRDITVVAEGQIRGKTFLTFAPGTVKASEPHARTAPAGTASKGVAEFDAADGKRTGLKVLGVYPVTAGGDITAADNVVVGAAGRALTAEDGAEGAVVVGQAITSASEGEDVFVFLVTN